MLLQIGILLFWACIGTCLVFCSPGRAMLKEVQGMTREQVRLLLNQKNASDIPQGCAILPGCLLELVQTFIVEAFYPIHALVAHLGSSTIAKWALVIVLSNLVHGLIEHKLKGGTYVYPALDAFYWFKVVLFALPTLYLWYLFAVLIGAIH